ncbi:hypothetical protein Btru_012386 [Bulinus truncatus]|nr:hypothetical protein Btru_012386 [Bulinus truncatus]
MNPARESHSSYRRAVSCSLCTRGRGTDDTARTVPWTRGSCRWQSREGQRRLLALKAAGFALPKVCCLELSGRGESKKEVFIKEMRNKNRTVFMIGQGL